MCLLPGIGFVAWQHYLRSILSGSVEHDGASPSSSLHTGPCGAVRQQDAGLQLSRACSVPGSSFVTSNTEPLSVGSAGHGDCCCYATVEKPV